MTPAPGLTVSVVLPPRPRPVKARVHRVEADGDITVIHPRNGGLRTVHPDAVRKVFKVKESR